MHRDFYIHQKHGGQSREEHESDHLRRKIQDKWATFQIWSRCNLFRAGKKENHDRLAYWPRFQPLATPVCIVCYSQKTGFVWMSAQTQFPHIGSRLSNIMAELKQVSNKQSGTKCHIFKTGKWRDLGSHGSMKNSEYSHAVISKMRPARTISAR